MAWLDDDEGDDPFPLVDDDDDDLDDQYEEEPEIAGDLFAERLDDPYGNAGFPTDRDDPADVIVAAVDETDFEDE